ncbi:MAG: chromosomal replication initiator protein DnaA [Phycisphaerales bacterium]|jgi:chromosomal replication initiator protein|nr:chromosomal replication initiator protein DnaA [Phycisphaerales bacterium]
MGDPDRKIWDGVLAHLRTNHPNLCRQWFEELEPVRLSGGALTLRSSSTIQRDYLHRQCLGAFNEAIQAVTQQLLGVRFVGPEDDASPEPSSPRTSDTPRRATAPRLNTHADSLVINPDCEFENFIVGAGNRLAYAASVAVADNLGLAYNPLFVHGGVGLGKTHLLQAICLRVADRRPDALIYYLSSEGFITQLVEAIETSTMPEFRHRFRDVDVLVIDDIHFLAGKDRIQEEFFHTFNALHQARKQIILSSDAAPEEIPQLEERLVSRFKWGLVAEVEPPEFETRVAIVRSKARLRGLKVPDEVASFIAERVASNIRELEGALTKVQMHAMIEDRPVDLALARVALGQRTAAQPAEPSVQAIVAAVTEYFGVRTVDLQGRRRQRSIALPRQVCMYLARQHTRLSLEEIGGHFGGRDHTTVMHAVRTIETKVASDQGFAATIQHLEQRVHGSTAA